MKRFIVFFFLLTVSLAVQGQKKSKKDKEQTQPTKEQTQPQQTQTEQVKPEQTQQQPAVQDQQPMVNALGEHYARKYAVATRWNDFDVVKHALYDLIIEYPSNDSLINALAILYYENQKYASSALISQDLLTRNPKSLPSLELAALSYEGLNLNDRALQNYESLYLISGSPTTLYKMAYLQYQVKRYPECVTNIDILLTKPEADSQKVVFNTPDNKEKEYAMRIALLNLKGMAFREQGDKVKARQYFGEALKLAPDFVPAKQNLTNLK